MIEKWYKSLSTGRAIDFNIKIDYSKYMELIAIQLKITSRTETNNLAIDSISVRDFVLN